MVYLRLSTITDEINGELMFHIKNNKLANTGEMPVGANPTVIAHDIIEHQRGLGMIKYFEDELVAIGGILYVRGMSGELSNYYSLEENLGGELHNLFRYLELSKLGTIKKPNVFFDSYTDGIIEKIIHFGRKDIRRDDQDEYRDNLYKLDEYLEYAEKCIYYGYYLASKRFKSKDIAFDMFKNIERAVSPFRPHTEGAEYILGYDRCEATMREVEYHEYA